MNDDYTTKQIYDFIQVLRKETDIIVTIFNQEKREVLLVFISNKDDSILEHHIKDFLDMEVN